MNILFKNEFLDKYNSYERKKSKYRYSPGDIVLTEIKKDVYLPIVIDKLNNYIPLVDGEFPEFEKPVDYVKSAYFKIDQYIRRGFAFRYDKDVDKNPLYYRTTHKKDRKTINTYHLKGSFKDACLELADNEDYKGARQVMLCTSAFNRAAIVVDIDEEAPFKPNVPKGWGQVNKTDSFCDWETNEILFSNANYWYLDKDYDGKYTGPGERNRNGRYKKRQAWYIDKRQKAWLEKLYNDYCVAIIGIKPSRVLINCEYKKGKGVEWHPQYFFFLKEGEEYINPYYRGHNPGYYFDPSDKIEYDLLTDAANLTFGGDPNFTGAFAKNPYGYRNLITFGEGQEYTREELKKAFSKSIEEIKKERIPVRKIRRKPNLIDLNTIPDIRPSIDDEKLGQSRNCYAYKNIFSIGYRMMSEGSLKNSEDLVESFQALEKESLKYNKKACIEDIKTIRNSCKGAFNSIQKNFDSSKVRKKNDIYDEATRAVEKEARQLRKCIRTLQYYILRQNGLKKKDIAKNLGVSLNSITSYAQADYEETIKFCMNYMNIHKNSMSSNVISKIEKIKDLFNTLNIEFFIEENNEEELKEDLRIIAINTLPENRINIIFNYMKIRADHRIRGKPKIDIYEYLNSA